MTQVRWERYPLVAQSPHARSWLSMQGNLGLAQNTVDAYGRALEDYLAFSSCESFSPEEASREHIARYVHDLSSRPNPRGANIRVLDTGYGLANATLQQRLTAVRLFYDYLTEEGLCKTNPVGRGRYTPGKQFGGVRSRGLLPRYRKLPWIPNEAEWTAVLHAAKEEPLRNRTMLALGYDAGLRREELCLLEIGDIDPSQRLVQIRAETTKSRSARVVPYSEQTGLLYMAYLQERRKLSRARGPVFVSESKRNRGEPISIWTWSKVTEGIAQRSGVQQFTTHTLRHLRLTDLARCGWDIHEIALFAGHRSTDTTLQYIHLSGRDLKAKVEQSMANIHAWRVRMMAEVLQ
ncbi:MAG TPA: tyrosine-type recombinase/integrase [Ktedonobacteraceae bacterium]